MLGASRGVRPVIALLYSAFVLFGLVGVLTLVTLVPPLVIDKEVSSLVAHGAPSSMNLADRLKAIGDLRATFLTLLGGIAVAFGTVIAALNLGQARRALEETQRQNRSAQDQTAEELRLRRQSGVNERFSRAVDQLGREEHAVRIGAIYALEQIACDAPEALHIPVMEMLTAFIRVESRKPGQGSEPPEPLAGDHSPRVLFRQDLQAALTVIGRRSGKQRQYETSGWSLDLRRSNLEGARLQNAYLRNVNFYKAVLRGADLSSANLRDAYLVRADLRDAYLNEAKLENADLREAQLGDATLEGARLKGADLSHVIGLTARQLEGTHDSGGAILPPLRAEADAEEDVPTSSP